MKKISEKTENVFPADLHIHTKFSADSEEEPRAQIESAIEKGASVLCFTDHMDYDFGAEGDTFTFDPESYFRALRPLADEYKDDLKVLIGVEFGMQPHLREKFEKLLKEWPFDYVIGSQHLVFGKDPYYRESFEGRTDREMIDRWFAEMSESLNVFPDIDALAHIDYIFRYVSDREKRYPYDTFRKQIGEILSFLIREGISLEINTGGFRKMECIPDFHRSLLAHYRELGGFKVVTGSDAHEAGRVMQDYEILKNLVNDTDFRAFTYYEKRYPKTLHFP